MPRIRVGVTHTLEQADWPEFLRFWQGLDRETLIDSLWTSDHLIPLASETGMDGPCLEGWTAAAAAAQATERLRIGCVATAVTMRHPSIVAKMAATLDHISLGRLEFGIGAAWHGGEHAAYGVEFPPVAQREDMLEEAVQVIRLLFRAEGPVDFDGTYYSLRQAPFAPVCVQRPHPPITVAGGGEKRTLRTAARYADAANVIGGVSTARRKMAVLDAHCEDAGRDPREVARSAVSPIWLTRSESEARDRRDAMVLYTGGDGAEDLAMGDADHIRDVIDRFLEAGVSQLVTVALPPFDLDQYQRLSDEVLIAYE